jgi:hypothetical protein
MFKIHNKSLTLNHTIFPLKCPSQAEKGHIFSNHCQFIEFEETESFRK